MESPKIRIKEVKGSGALLKFIKFPWQVYKDDRAWVPPLIIERKDFLNKKKNPFFKHSDVKLFLAYKDGKVAGRIAACINHNHNSFHEEKVGFFGLFECINDHLVSYGLLDAAKKFALENGMTRLMGPLNLSTNDESGLLIEGFFKPPTVMMPYNPQYYADLLLKFGLKKARDLYAYYLESSRGMPGRARSMIEKIKQRYRVLVRPINPRKFNEDVEHIKIVYNKAWSRNWGFVPMTDEEFRYMATQLKQIYDPDFVFIAFIDKQPVGFSLTLPNINEVLCKLNGTLFPTGIFKLLYYTKFRKIIRGSRIITMGVIPEFQKRGIDNIFYDENFKTALKKGYRWGEISWVLEDNDMMNRAANMLGGKLYKKYRIYDMDIY